jgi:hypothetical protein
VASNDYFVPFNSAWISDRLYRGVADFGTAGRAVEIDGWHGAMDAAWHQLVDALPDGSSWVEDYRAAALDCHLSVVFKDVTRVTGRRGYGGFGVSYPTELLLAEGDKVVAMRTAILAAIDRHVERCQLDVPLLSEAVRNA